MGPAERVAEVVGPHLPRHVQHPESKIEVDATTSKQPLDQQYVEHLSWLHAPAVEVHALSAWPPLELVEGILVNF
jgi:hypothetical protein